MIAGIKKTIGKTIAGIVIKESDNEPKSQIFFIFSDDSSYEIYSDKSKIFGSTDLQPYGLDGVKKCMSTTHKIVDEFYDESLMKP